jgi:hypothetical protein
MGLETLKSAERAAGFAMAPADDPERPIETSVEPEVEEWRPHAPVFTKAAAQAVGAKSAKSAHSTVADWVKGLFGSSGRRAPA